MTKFILSLTFAICTSATAQVISSFPYYTGFEGQVGTLNENFPEGWTAQDLNPQDFGNQGWQIIKNTSSIQNANTDSTAVHLFSNPNVANDDFLFTPAIEMMAGEEYVVTFFYSVASIFNSTEKLEILVGEAANAASMSEIPLWSNTAITNTEYESATFSYTPESSGQQVFAFHCFSAAFEFILLVDDVTIDISTANVISPLVPIFRVQNDLLKKEIRVENSQMNSDCLVQIMDMTGKIIHEKGLSKNSNLLVSTAEFSSGIYLLHISTHGNVTLFTEKVFIR